jgi:hypothetical protein
MTVALQAGGVDAASVLGDLHRISVTQWRELPTVTAHYSVG